MKYFAIAGIVGFVVTGCSVTQPVFDTSKTEIRMIDGKHFELPASATKSAHIATADEIDFYQKSGVNNCRKGDVIWDIEGTQRQIAKAIKEGNPNIHKTLAKRGLIGCAHPVK